MNPYAHPMERGGIAEAEGLPLFDCSTFESAIESIARATAQELAYIAGRVESFDRTATFDPMLDPGVERPKALIQWIDRGLTSELFGGAYYFHGSRVLAPESFFRRGIRPLPEMLDEIWAQLGEIASPDVTGDEWIEFRRWFEDESAHEFAGLLQMKTHDPIHHGPYAEIIRPMLIDPAQCRHDYLRTPESVEDICHVVTSRFGIDLLSRFRAASVPCIVKFKSEQFSDNQLSAVATFLIDHLDGDQTENVYGYIPNGSAIPPNSVVAVDTFPT